MFICCSVLEIFRFENLKNSANFQCKKLCKRMWINLYNIPECTGFSIPECNICVSLMVTYWWYFLSFYILHKCTNFSFWNVDLFVVWIYIICKCCSYMVSGSEFCSPTTLSTNFHRAGLFILIRAFTQNY